MHRAEVHLMVSKKFVIPAPRNSNEKPFEVVKNLTVFEAAMIYACRHPLPRFLKDGNIEEHLGFLRAGVRDSELYTTDRASAQLSWDIYCELMKRIASGKVNPLSSAYFEDGKINPVRTLIRTLDVAELARERGERPKYLSHLQTDQAETRPAPPSNREEHSLAAKPASPRRKRGPVPDTVGYGASDRALFSDIERIRREDNTKSVHAAALELADDIKGGGTPPNKAKRLARRYLNSLNPTETNSN
jgi:hypothetical protein